MAFAESIADYEKRHDNKYLTMATILNDTELKKLFDTVIENADEECIRPNSYILRLGADGIFIGTDKEFKIKEGKGIRLAPGHAVGITTLEKINFSRSTVQKAFPDCDFHGFLSPTTDLSREGLIASSTQIDAGYKGTLNWTITNTSSKTAEFVYGEKLFRMTIVCLKEGERPKSPYAGDYQEKDGYVGSKRSTAPRGMKSSDWVDTFQKGGPEEKMDELIKKGYPWNILGTRLKQIDNQLKTVTEEYGIIHDSMDKLNQKISGMEQSITNTVNNLFDKLETTFILKIITAFVGLLGLLVVLMSSSILWGSIVNNLSIVGAMLLVICGLLIFYIVKKRK